MVYRRNMNKEEELMQAKLISDTSVIPGKIYKLCRFPNTLPSRGVYGIISEKGFLNKDWDLCFKFYDLNKKHIFILTMDLWVVEEL